ncbi:PREDICTED: acyl-CoA synthetase family member 2, mitochondrial-like [Rhagoletis zephyria]|uniref:acyl-CoA synthetase family member 2, mitochondrial-like n=1 Tax=Rhagoletis zephyria TaxID=28612 RepID=UPI0008118342|nr:PREDICTED: acyl-CoA synthetase family member 2, mitochondrial-like [Rhagoletis zephyria]XP_017480364.1 PREDICTED: acyl-CoA synthetase family member 2, mitochondrial-like [Rhagoletis zephyria]XP_017480365.1 PREDICTED: acyl-CoA synthetase family member 2, mitochondrial-like [Rhagoletis zephyria]
MIKQLQPASLQFYKNVLRANSQPHTHYLGRCLSTPPAVFIKSHNFHPAHLHHIGKAPLIYRNVGQELERAAAEYGSTESIVSFHEQKRYTFQGLIEEADRVAAGLLKLGLKQGDHVGIWAPNNMHWYLTLMGAARAGLVSVGINPAFQGPEVEYCLKKVKVKALIMPETFKKQNFYEIIKSICPELPDRVDGSINSTSLPHLKHVIIDTDNKLKGALSFDQLLGLSNPVEREAISKLQHRIVPDSGCNVQFTSGTTGRPKAAVLSHYNFVNNGTHIGNRNLLDSNSRICVQVPLFHVYGVVVTVMAAMTHGSTLVLPAAGFSPADTLRAIVDEKCTVVHGTPTMYVDLIKKQRELKLPLKTAKMAVTGGAPCSPQLFLDIKNILGLERIHTVYGLTETTAVVFQTRPGDSMERILNTVGHLQDHVEVKVVDGEGHTVQFGEPGELYVRGYATMLEYYDDEVKTKETIGNDKWLKTGDQFILESDGYGRILGRLKEMIIRGGENIFPKEIEDFLNSHPKIIETHVIGVPDERLGEECCAFVRLQDGVKSIAREEVKEFAQGKLAHFKIPRYVIPINAFPRTTSGKIQKFKLAEEYNKMQRQ